MTTAAKSTYSGIRYKDPPPTNRLHVELLHRYYRRLVQKRLVADIVERRSAQSRLPSVPLWLNDVLRRINDSVAPFGMNEEFAGHWISQSVAEASKRFLSQNAARLPAEPHIYASPDGELVAEFQGRNGTMTSTVSPDFVVLFASVNGQGIYWRSSDDEGAVTGAVEKMKDMLETGKHGDMEARS